MQTGEVRIPMPDGEAARTATLALGLMLLALSAAAPVTASDAPPPPPSPPPLPAALRSFDRVRDALFGGETELEQWWQGPALTGTWFGWRDRLADLGVQVALTYTADILGNASGGIDQNVRYFQNVGFDLLFDLDKLAHIPGAHFQFALAQGSGKSLSDEDIGNVFNVSQLCCGPYVEVVTAAWEQQLFDDRLGIRVGHLSMGDDFFTSPLYWQFVNSGIDSVPGSLLFNVPFTTYPDATFGLRIRGRPIEPLTLQVGVYNDDLDANAAHGGNFHVDLSDGVMILAEVGYHDHVGGPTLALPGHVSLGGYFHTGRFRKLDAPSGSNLPSDADYGSGGIYAAVDQMLWRFHAAPDPRGVVPFVSVVGAPNAEISQFPFFFNAGVVGRGPIPARPHDDVVFGVLYGGFSGVLRDGQRAAGEPLQDFEMVLEWAYILQITPWLQLEPDIQYVIRPGGTGDLPNALVLGAQIAVNI
jgi:porin